MVCGDTTMAAAPRAGLPLVLARGLTRVYFHVMVINMELDTGTRPYRMVARARSVERTHERILDAAVAAFWSTPTTDIPLDEIANEAEVSVQTVLRHFGSKDGVFAAATDREAERLTAHRDAAAPGDLVGAVRILLDHYEDVGDGVLRMLAEEHHVAGLGRVVERGRSYHRTWCQRVFADTLAPLTGVDRSRRLAQLVAVCDVYTWKLLRCDAGLSRRQTEQALLELLEPLLEAS